MQPSINCTRRRFFFIKQAFNIKLCCSGVTVAGSGATKTITIPGGGGDIFKNIAMPDGSTVVAWIVQLTH